MKSFSVLARMLIASMLVAFAGITAAQHDYPNKPIHIIVPFPPGASNDYVARLVGSKLAENLGQTVIVENRPGADTVIGSEALVKSPPDGYTIMLTSIAHVFNALLLTTPYDAIKDFAPIATTTSNRLVLVVHPSVPANTLGEFIALAKSKPGQLNYGSSGNGNPTHLAGELFCMMTGVRMQHVPYKGGSQGVADLVGGHLQLSFQSPVSAIPLIKSRKLRPIAITGETRAWALPDVHTFAEAGLPGFDVKSWHGIFAPAGTPAQVIDKLSSEIAKIVSTPDVKEKLLSQVMDPFPSTPGEFAELIKADIVKYGKLIKAANIKVEK